MIKIIDYKIPLNALKKAGIEPEVGTGLTITLKDGTVVITKITKVEKENVIATSE